jgi:exosortase A
VQTWWNSPTYSHCFLVIPIFAYLVWRKRGELASVTPAPEPLALLLAVPAGLFWLAGNAAAINEVLQLAAMTMFEMLVLAILGRQAFRILLFPCLFLFFLVPMGQYLVTPLQDLTTWFVSAGLSALGILHYTEGNVIQLVNGNFAVAEACAGLRFLVANIALCVLFCYLTFHQPRKIILFMIAAVAAPILGNCLRALGIVLIAHWTDNRLAVGADHLVYGWGFSVAIMFLLFAVGARYRDKNPEPLPRLRLDYHDPQPAFRLVWVALAAALLMSAPPALAGVLTTIAPPAELSLSPLKHAGWSVGRPAGRWLPDLPAGDTQLHLSLRQPAKAPLDFVLDYYRSETKNHSLIVGVNRLWDERQYNLVRAGAVGGQPQNGLSELLLASGAEKTLVWWTYWKDGAFTTSGARIKWLSLRDALWPHTGSAFLALAIPVSGTEDEARAELRSALWAFGIMPESGNRETP